MTELFASVEWPVLTDRLVLRPATTDDLPAIFAYRSQPAVARWIGGETGDLAHFSAQFLDRPGIEQLAVERDSQVIGDLMVTIEDAWSQREVRDQAARTLGTLGWTFDPAHQGRGLATEAVRALLDLCFGPFGVRRVRAECFSDNHASWRLMERLGMRREAHFVQDSLHRDLGWLDEYVYGLLASEWPGGR